jgi:hypothetical protein
MSRVKVRRLKVLHIRKAGCRTYGVSACESRPLPLCVDPHEVEKYMKSGNFKLCKKCTKALSK